MSSEKQHNQTSETSPEKKQSWWRHAFALDDPEKAEPTAEQQQAIDAICKEVLRRQLATPVSLFLSMSEPLNYVSAQVLHFLSPFLSVVSKTDGHKQIALFLEQRHSLNYIINRLEELSNNSNKPTTAQSETINSTQQGTHG